MPFSRVRETDERHGLELAALCKQLDVEVPVPTDGGEVQVPDSLVDACAAAVQAERENVAVYDGYLESATNAEVREAFSRLRATSADRQLAAFTRCVENDGKYIAPTVAKAGSCGSCGMGNCGCAGGIANEPVRPRGCGCAQRRK